MHDDKQKMVITVFFDSLPDYETTKREIAKALDTSVNNIHIQIRESNNERDARRKRLGIVRKPTFLSRKAQLGG